MSNQLFYPKCIFYLTGVWAQAGSVATATMSWQGSNWKSWGWGQGGWNDGDGAPPATPPPADAGAPDVPPTPLGAADTADVAADDGPTSAPAVILMIGLRVLHRMLGSVETFSEFAGRLMPLSTSSSSGSSGPSSDQLLVELARDLGANCLVEEIHTQAFKIMCAFPAVLCWPFWCLFFLSHRC